MNTDKLRLKTPITYYGGKQKMVKDILPLIPPHTVYTEPFFGGGAIFFAKEPAPLEIINDLNSHVVNFYFCLKVHFKELSELVQASLHSREAYRDAQVMYDRPHLFSRVQRAWSFWVLTNQGFAGRIGSWGFDRKEKAKVGITISNKKLAFGKHLEERLNVVQIECDDALRVIQSRDSESTFHYVDPPYFNSDCGHYKGYTEQDFRDLLEVLARVKGRFLLSSYPSDLLKEYAQKYNFSQKFSDMYVGASALNTSGKKTKTEVLTANYELT